MLEGHDIHDLLKGRTLGVARVGSILVLAHGPQPLAADEWAHYCEVIARHHPDFTGQIVLGEGPGPTAAQRKKSLDECVRGLPIPPTVVFTHSPLVRHVVAIFNWFSPRAMRAYFPDELEPAARHLGIDVVQMEQLVAFARSLQPKP